jgi:hypothetical protein
MDRIDIQRVPTDRYLRKRTYHLQSFLPPESPNTSKEPGPSQLPTRHLKAWRKQRVKKCITPK